MTHCFPASGRRLVQHAKGCQATFVNGAEIVASDEFMGELLGSCYATGGTQLKSFDYHPAIEILDFGLFT